MLCKESFIIIAPAFIVFKLWYEKNKYELSIKETLRNNSLLVIPFLVMCFSLWLIIFVIGTNKIIYAGINSNINIIPLINGSYRILRNSLFEINIIIILSLLLIYYELKDEKKFKAILIELILPAIFAFLIVVPNLILYAKSGMDERYLLPSTIGIAFLAVSILRTINKNHSWLFKLLVVIILIIFAKPTNMVVKRARNFANEGFQTEKMFAAIIQNSNENSNILLVANPAYYSEWSNSLRTYLSLTNDINLYGFPVNDEYQNDFDKFLSETWHLRFEGRKFEDIKGDIDIIVFFNKKMDSLFYEESGLNPLNYNNLLEQDTDFGVYKRK
jgi:glycerol uptake facilitator-like aquaporin